MEYKNVIVSERKLLASVADEFASVNTSNGFGILKKSWPTAISTDAGETSKRVFSPW
jgi:hypothetical protein